MMLAPVQEGVTGTPVSPEDARADAHPLATVTTFRPLFIDLGEGPSS
jgi:hypothetical protein